MASSYGNAVLDKGYAAAAAITKNRFVKFSAEDTVTPVTASTDVACGVALVSVSSTEQTRGKGVPVRMAPGIAEVDVGSGGVTAGAKVMSDTSGQAIAAATSGNQILGIALQTKTNGQRAAIKLQAPATI